MSANRPIGLNLFLAAGFTAVNLWQFIILPPAFLPRSPWWLLTLVPAALLSNSLWFLMHEAVHNNLVRGRKWNELLGRFLAVGFGAPFEVLRFGHLMHHRFNGAEFDRPDLYDPERNGPLKARVGYYVNILGGLYAEELFSYFIFFLPKAAIDGLAGRFFKSSDVDAERKFWEAARKILVNDGVVRSVRLQGAVFLIMLGLSMVLYDVLWYVPLLILAVRAFFISFANNLPHYGTANDDRLYGLNLSMPRWAHHFYLNFYHHRAHHHEPLVPWTGLPDSFRDQGMEYDMPFLSAALAQFKGPKPMPPAASDAGAA